MTDHVLPEAELLAQPTNQLLDAFGAGQASPGSGSAAALMGLLAVKLIRTVCLKSLQKNPERNTEVTLRHLLDELGAIEPSLRTLFEKDAREFDEIVRLRMERDAATDPDAKSTASRRANDLLEVATDNTFQIIDLCLPLIDHGVTVFGGRRWMRYVRNSWCVVPAKRLSPTSMPWTRETCEVFTLPLAASAPHAVKPCLRSAAKRKRLQRRSLHGRT